MNNRIKNLFVFLVPSLLIGCVKEIEQRQPQENPHEVVFHASWAPETKTVLQEDGSVWWSPGDEINLFPQYYDDSYGGYYTHPFKFISTTEGASPSTDFVYNGDDFRQSDEYVAVFPYNSENIAFKSKYILVTIPTVQMAPCGTFDHKAFASVAISKDENLQFRNICGGIKFSVSQDGIKEVSFKNLNGYALSGLIHLNYDFENDKNQIAGNTTFPEIIVRPKGSTYFEVGKYYYAVMFPFEHDETAYPYEKQFPLLVTFRKDNEKATYLTEGKAQIKRSVFKRLYNKDKDLTFVPIKDEAIMMSTLPDGVDNKSITEVYFHPSSSKTTETNLGTEESPIYFELNDTIVNYYTPKESFNLKNVTSHMFWNWESLVKVDFTGVDTSEATDFVYFFGECHNLKELNTECINTSSAVNFWSMFRNCKNLERLDLSSFNTEHVIDMSAMFEGCRNLRELNLCSFDTQRCKEIIGIFNNCTSLEKLDLSKFDLSSVDITSMCSRIAIKRKQCIVKASDLTWSKMCSDNADMPYASMNYYIKRITPDEAFPALEDKFAGFYKSTDYSKDYTYKLIQKATVGKGIDIVIMGDAYSDRLINDGTYDQDLGNAIENIFSEEPLKSLRDYFNVYVTYAVSEHEKIEGITAFSLVFKDMSSHIDAAFDGTIDDYMRATLPSYGYEFSTGRPIPYIIIVSNCHLHAGVTYSFTSGSSVVLTSLETDDSDFHAVICHEFGHAIGKLADEYDQEGLTFYDQYNFKQESSKGFWPNVYITNDSNAVKWYRFLSDERYSNQGLGVFEGGFEKYACGIWRPTENSIMGSATTGFNAPCREAIYKNVNSLADDSFVYDYETFVAFDQNAKLVSNIAERRISQKNNTSLQRLPSPVFIDNGPITSGASTTISK